MQLPDERVVFRESDILLCYLSNGYHKCYALLFGERYFVLAEVHGCKLTNLFSLYQ